MESNDPAFEELSRRIGRVFISWASLESAINITVSSIIEQWVEPSTPIDKPRNFSKKTEFIRRLFREHPAWQSLEPTVTDLMNQIDGLADTRNALAHGQMVDITDSLAGNDIQVMLQKRSKGKERLLHYKFSHDYILALGQAIFVNSVFVARLAEIIRDDLGEHDLDNLLSEIVGKIAAPLPVADLGSDQPD